MKDVEVDYLYSTASRLIHKNRCRLVAVLVTAQDDKAAYVDVYDGINTTEPKAMRVRSPQKESRLIEFSKPVLMKRGIYISMHADAESYTIFWEPIED